MKTDVLTPHGNIRLYWGFPGFLKKKKKRHRNAKQQNVFRTVMSGELEKHALQTDIQGLHRMILNMDSYFGA